MRVLTTGGAGFHGTHLSDLLVENGHSVTSIDSLVTGRMSHIAHLPGHERFSLYR